MVDSSDKILEKQNKSADMAKVYEVTSIWTYQRVHEK